MWPFKKKDRIKAVEITEQNFQELVLNSKQPVLLDFWAAWCGPCGVIGPIVDELAEDYTGRAVIGKINTAVSQQLSASFKIKSIPTIIFIHNAQIYARYNGLVPKPNLEEILDELLALEEIK